MFEKDPLSMMKFNDRGGPVQRGRIKRAVSRCLMHRTYSFENSDRLFTNITSMDRCDPQMQLLDFAILAVSFEV